MPVPPSNEVDGSGSSAEKGAQCGWQESDGCHADYDPQPTHSHRIVFQA